MAELTI